MTFQRPINDSVPCSVFLVPCSPCSVFPKPRWPHLCNLSRIMGNLLWLIIIILIILWLGGFAFHIGGGLIHILIVIALILLIVRLVTGRRVV